MKPSLEQISSKEQFFAAVAEGKANEIAEEITNIKKYLNTIDEASQTPLHIAIARGHKNIALMILAHRPPLDIQDKRGFTPLHIAVENNFYNLAESLIFYQADINVKCFQGFTPLHLAISKQNGKMVELLLAYKAKKDLQDQDGWTPLHLATSHRCLNIMKSLLEQGAEVDIVDTDGLNPLHIAVSEDFPEGVDLLLSYGADYKAENNHQQTPLSLATNSTQSEVQKIIEYHRIRRKEEMPPSVKELPILKSVVQQQQHVMEQLHFKIKDLILMPEEPVSELTPDFCKRKRIKTSSLISDDGNMNNLSDSIKGNSLSDLQEKFASSPSSSNRYLNFWNNQLKKTRSKEYFTPMGRSKNSSDSSSNHSSRHSSLDLNKQY